MGTYILDTGIVLGYLRESGYAKYVERHFSVSSPPNISLISIVTVGEMQSLSMQLGWGENKRQLLDDLIKLIPIVDISNDQIIERYAQIDSYSQGKNPLKPLPMTPRNMGKNDIWIAATGSVANATLLTTDKDFGHLNGVFLPVEYIDQNLT